MDLSMVPYMAQALRKGRTQLPESAQMAMGFIPGVGQAESIADMTAPDASVGERISGAMGFVPFGKLVGAAAGPVIAKMGSSVIDFGAKKRQMIIDALRKKNTWEGRFEAAKLKIPPHEIAGVSKEEAKGLMDKYFGPGGPKSMTSEELEKFEKIGSFEHNPFEPKPGSSLAHKMSEMWSKLLRTEKEIPMSLEERIADKTGQIPIPEKPPQAIIDSMKAKAAQGDASAQSWLDKFGQD